MRQLQIDPKASNLYFLENPISRKKATRKIPFDPTKSDPSPPRIMEFQGGFFIFNGNHRIYAARTLDPSPPPSMQVHMYTVDEYATHTGLSRQWLLHYIGRATANPTLGP